MAALDATLGTRYDATGGTSPTLTTSAAAAAGTRIILFAGWTTGPVAAHMTSVTGGGLTWVVDRNDDDEVNFFGTGIASADAPSGLASSTVITMNFDGSAAQVASAAASFTGVATGASGYVDVTVAPASATTAAWSSGAMVTTQDDVLVVAVYGDNTRTSTTTGPATELFDFNGGGGFNCMTVAYQIVTTAGSTTISGTWDTTPIDWQAVGVGYEVAPGAAQFRPVQVASPVRW